MSTIATLAALILLSSSPGEEVATTPIAHKARPPHELRKAVHDTLKRSAPTSDPDPAVLTPELISLGEELRVDTQVEEHDRKRLRGLIRQRLESILKQLEKTVATEPPPGRRPQAAKEPPNVQVRGEILAQQGLPPGGGGGGAGIGGGGAGAGQAGGLAAQTNANARDLIESIKRTIAPTTWDDVGGPGTIRYYAPLQVLVIRQTGEVHEKIGGGLGKLRK